MYNYAQINEENICIVVSQLSCEIVNNKMIRLIDEDISKEVLGHKYENGKWSEENFNQPPELDQTQNFTTNEEIKEN